MKPAAGGAMGTSRPTSGQVEPAVLSGINRLRGLLAGIVALTTLLGCERTGTATRGIRLATATSYLECAAVDILGENASVVRLAEPGTCPGHFDIRPSQVTELRVCAALLRFDFQKSLDARLHGGGTNQPRVAEITIRGGMCCPESYLSTCRQVAGSLVSLGLTPRPEADARLVGVAARIADLARDATNRVARAALIGTPVLASGHQRDFCNWLGLRVVGEFRSADAASVAEINRAVDAGQLADVRFVISNLPEGRRTADALAERLKAKVVVFGNFPALQHGRVSFDEMVRSNVTALLDASGS